MTIFIICFLLLDIFLGYQLVLRQKSADNQVSNFTQSSFSQYIKNKNIQINAPLPDGNQSVTFLSGRYLNFGEAGNKELQQSLQQLAGPKKTPTQKFQVETPSTVIESTFTHRVAVPQTQTDQQLFLKQYVYQGETYRFWSYDKTQHIYKFIQTYNGHPVFSLINKKLNTLNLQTDPTGKWIEGYTQTFIDIKEEHQAKLNVQPMDAIQQLWEKNKIPVIDRPVIEQMELGYINLSENGDQSQSLAYLPAWYIEVKTNQAINHFFVTGIYGRIQTIDGGE
jgi:regulatory protein YycI of two-component signal transduction system YycFG